MQDIPESVQGLLGFLNLGCIQGMPSLWRFPVTKRKLKRPPILNGKILFDGITVVPTLADFKKIFYKYQSNKPFGMGKIIYAKPRL
ncbi:MAG TPA: hypothetical protein ACFYEC_07320 [Candidatus Brocadiaceae bacterium]